MEVTEVVPMDHFSQRYHIRYDSFDNTVKRLCLHKDAVNERISNDIWKNNRE